MHVPDGFLDAQTSIGTGVLAAGVVAVSLRKARGELDDRTAPLAGLVAVFIFAGQMLNFPVGAGTSGHLLGGALAAVLVGPWVATLCLTVVLIVLFFTILRIPALVMLGVWFAQQAVLAALGLTETVGDGDGIAYFAHIGGFAFGLATITLLRPRRNPVYAELVAARRDPQARTLAAPEAPRGTRRRWRW